MAAGVRIFWLPLDSTDVARYEIYRALTATMPFALLNIVQHQVPGPNFDAAKQRFFYDDVGGQGDSFYKVLYLTSLGIQLSATDPFQPEGAVAADLAARTRVDHNFGAPDNLRYVGPSGAGVPDAVVRLFKKPDYDAGRVDLAIAVTRTRDDGRWSAPAFLEQGFSYVVHFEKLRAFGPDTVTIVV
jgi:hypothetical protein